MSAFYVHFIHKQEASSPEEAKEYAELYNSIIDCIAVKHPVFVRRPPEIWEERSFEENRTMYYAQVRFTVGDEKKAGVKGRIEGS